ncbi:MAG: IPT/TIG domain-containing protein [Planctomycetes bacterium]|nr:IPT/TIG domain-containing protein [Planctomycetota bacterium]
MSRQNLFVGALITGLALISVGCNNGSSSKGGGGGTTVTVTAISPATGKIAGGTTVTITGTNFTSPAEVRFNNVLAAVTAVTPTTITAITPVGSPGTINVSVTIDGQTVTLSASYSYADVSVSAISPNSGGLTGNTPVTITGTGFASVTDVTPLNPGFTVVSPTEITGTIATSATLGAVDVVVTTSDNGSGTLTNGWTYTPGGGGPTAPGVATLTAISVPEGPQTGSTIVTIVGTGIAGVTTVTFGGTAATIVGTPTATQIVVSTPAHAVGLVDVVVATASNGTATLPLAYAYIDPAGVPTVSAISPVSGTEAGNTTITITGTNFNNATIATVGSSIVNFRVINSTQIVGKTAPRDLAATTTPTVRVTGPLGTSAQPVLFTYSPALVLDSVTPNQGPTSGSVAVTIKGRNFVGNLIDVKFDGVSTISSITILSATEAIVTTPAGSPGPANIELVSSNQATTPGSIKTQAYTFGDILANPVFPGDFFGAQTGTASMANVQSAVGVGLKSRVCVGDYTTTLGQEFVAVTLPGSNQVYVKTTGGTNTITLNGGGQPVDAVWTLTSEDGFPDLAVLKSTGQVVLIHFSTINPTTFTQDAAMATGITITPTSITTADLTGDFVFDIAICGDDNEVAVLAYSTATNLLLGPVASTVPVGSNPVRIMGADPNGVRVLRLNPIDDLAVIELLPKQLKLDLNRDGKSDLIVLNGNGTISICQGTNTLPLPPANIRTFVTAQPLNAPIDLTVTDLDSDNRLDIVALTATDIAVFRTTTNSQQASIAQIQTLAFVANSTPTGVAFGDTNFNCRDDLLVSSTDVGGPNVATYLSNGDGSFGAPILYVAHVPPNMTAGEEVIDVAWARSKKLWAVAMHFDPNRRGLVQIPSALINIFTGDAPTPLTTAPTGREPRAPRLYDFNDDGRNDLIYTNFADNTFSIRLGDGNGGFGAPTNIATSKGPESLAFADVNQDGLVDVIVANDFGVGQPSRVTVHINQGNGAVAPIGIALVIGGEGVRDVQLLDVSNDGRVDVVTVNQGTNNVSVLLGTGSGPFYFGTARVYGVQNEPLGMALADMGVPEGTDASVQLAADGMIDIVVCNSADDSVSILYNGFDLSSPGTAGRFGQGERYPLGGSIRPKVIPFPNQPNLLRFGVEPRSVAVADLNADGALDIITADQGTSTITILHGNSQNTALTSLSSPLFPGNVRKYYLPTDYRYDAGGTQDIGRPQVVLPAGTQVQWLRIADMNVDGRLDIVATSFVGMNMTIYINGGRDLQRGPIGPQLPPLPGPPPVAPPKDHPTQHTLGETYFRSPLSNFAIGYSNASNVATAFTNGVNGQVTGMTIGKVNVDCPPDVVMTRADNTFLIHKGE